jgi:uncharacterized membrane protein
MRFASSDLLFLALLFLHIGGAIVAFGPSFAYPIIGAMGGRDPQHAAFAAKVSATIGKRLVTPVAIWVGVTGVLLIVVSGRNPLELWLATAIVLYVVALAFSLFVAGPDSARLVEALSAPPPRPPAGASPPAGPPPHIAPLVAGAQRNGMVLMVLLVAIVLLMVFKPMPG